MTTAIHSKPDSVGRRIIKNLAMLFGGKTAAALIGLVVLALAARALSMETLGSLILLHAYVTLMSGLASFKSWQAVIQFGAGPVTGGDTAAFHTLLRFTIGLDLLAAVVAMLVSVCVFPIIRPLIGLPEDMLVPGILYCLLTVINLRSSPLGVLRLLDRFDLISLHSLIVPIVRLAGAVSGLALGAGLEWFVAAWFLANAISYLVMPILGLRELARRRLLKGLFARPISLRAPQKGIWRFVWLANLDATIDLVDTHVATFLSGLLLGPAFAAMFKIARDLSDVLAKSARMLDRAMYPELVRLMLAGESARALVIIVRTSLIMLGIGAVLGALIYVFGPAIFASALDAGYVGIAPIATMLMIAAALFAATAPLYPALFALGEPARATIARAGGVSAIIVLFFILSHLLGEDGPGFAMVVGQLIGLVLAASMALSRLQVRRKADGQSALSRASTASTSPGSAEPDPRSGTPGQPESSSSQVPK